MSDLVKELQTKHLELLARAEKDGAEDSELTEDVQAFVTELRKAGSVVQDVRLRSQLRTLSHYWGNFIYGQTGVSPETGLMPFTGQVEAAVPGLTFLKGRGIVAAIIVLVILAFPTIYLVSHFMQNGGTPTPAVGSTSTPILTWTDTATPTSTSTPTPTPTSTFTPTPTSTSTPTPTSTSTPTPTSTFTPTPTSTVMPIPTRTPTPTPGPYPPPQLLGPIEGTIYSAEVTFLWTWPGEMAENDFFALRLWSQTQPDEKFTVALVRDTRQFVMSLENYAAGEYCWDVSVVSTVATTPKSMKWSPLSRSSPRCFVVQK